MAEATPNTAAEAAPIKTVKMELKRHYVPHKLVSIIGYQRPEKRAKTAAGTEIITQTAAFIEGEMMPAAYPGVGFPNKIWAGTVIEVPEDEARDMRAKKIAEAYL